MLLVLEKNLYLIFILKETATNACWCMFPLFSKRYNLDASNKAALHTRIHSALFFWQKEHIDSGVRPMMDMDVNSAIYNDVNNWQ